MNKLSILAAGLGWRVRLLKRRWLHFVEWVKQTFVLGTEHLSPGEEGVSCLDASMEPIVFELRDIDPDVVRAWEKYFVFVANVRTSHGDIFEADAIVSPANSFGYMDGGIDLVYIHRFGWELQARLQGHLRDEHDGELPVGQAIIVETYDAAIPYLVSAPTMRRPWPGAGQRQTVGLLWYVCAPTPFADPNSVAAQFNLSPRRSGRFFATASRRKLP